jgi:uncharacterized protein YcfL
MMKQLLTVFCVAGLLTLTGCSSDKKNDIMPESVETQMADDNGTDTDISISEDTTSEDMPDMDDDGSK